MVKTNASAKFDETVELALNLGVDPKHADQMVRGVVNLPNGTGRTLRVAVFARGAKADEAREAGADIVGAEDLVAAVQGGEINFDRCIATPDLMPLVGRLGKVLGPRGLMPNPKVGTVTMDVKAAVAASKGGAVEFRAEKAGIVQGSVGKASFADDKLAENIRAFVDAVNKAKPPGPRATICCAPPSPRPWGPASGSTFRRCRPRPRSERSPFSRKGRKVGASATGSGKDAQVTLFAAPLPIDEALPALRAALSHEHARRAGRAARRRQDDARSARAASTSPGPRAASILVLEPRRLAARAAAARMAATLGEKVGETVGLRVRLQSLVSARTRIEVVTEGVFTRMILDDPALEGVAAVLFDEFHERSLDADLGLALALDAQAGLREDLRLLVMSATLDGARVRRSARRRAADRERGPRLSRRDALCRARLHARASRTRSPARSCARSPSETGSILVFLPGQGEIRRVAETAGGARPAAGRRHRAALRRDGLRARRIAPSSLRRRAGARSCWRPRSPRPR